MQGITHPQRGARYEQNVIVYLVRLIEWLAHTKGAWASFMRQLVAGRGLARSPCHLSGGSIPTGPRQGASPSPPLRVVVHSAVNLIARCVARPPGTCRPRSRPQFAVSLRGVVQVHPSAPAQKRRAVCAIYSSMATHGRTTWFKGRPLGLMTLFSPGRAPARKRQRSTMLV